MDDYTSWMSRTADVARALQEQDIQRQKLPGQLEEQNVLNQLKQQLLQQQGKSFPMKNEAAQLELQRAQQQAPQQQFADLVGTYGGNIGGEEFVRQRPELAQQLFSQGADQGPPDVRGNAREAGNQLYNLGPETARKIRGDTEIEANRFPFQKALQKSAADAQVSAFQRELPGNIQIAQAGQGATAAENAKHRQSTVAGIAFQNFATNPALAHGLPALESTASTVETEQGARTLINQIGALKAQIKYAGDSSVAIGAQMGADPSLDIKLQALTNAALSRLDNIHRQLYNKYWGPNAEKSVNPFDTIGAAPNDTLGYTP